MLLQGLATLRMLWQLQERTGRRIHELFDLVCGTSTGGILAAALAVRCVPLAECEEIYRRASVGPRTAVQPPVSLTALACGTLTGSLLPAVLVIRCELLAECREIHRHTRCSRRCRLAWFHGNMRDVAARSITCV